MVLASAITYFTTINPATVALIVAIGATSAKLIHYYVAAAMGKRVDSSRYKFSKYSETLGKWGALGAFVAAVTPIPDDPVVISLGLIGYDSLKFTISYFIGKLMIALFGSYGTQVASSRLDILFGNSASIIASIIISVLIITILLRMDPTEIQRYVTKFRARIGKKSE